MKRVFIFLFICTFPMLLLGQVSYDGPANGSIAQGVTVNTDDFSNKVSSSHTGFAKFKLFNNETPDQFIDGGNLVKPLGPEGSNYFATPDNLRRSVDDSMIVFSTFEGIPMEADPQGFTHIPPDTYLAVGPNHVIQVVNTEFRITDKEGNEVKSIWAKEWFGTVGVTNVDPFDCKVLYDHFSQRWVQVWLHQNSATSEAYYLVSVSDDDDPTGVWFNWALPSTTNGNTPAGNWSDYQGVGFDHQAIYITGRQFTFSGSKQYEKIRIIPKEYFYVDSDPGMVRWKDLWNITYPNTTAKPDGIRPSRMFTQSDTYYLAIELPANAMTVYKLTDPVNNPTLTGVNVPVTAFSSPPNAGQLGGGSPAIDGGGSRLRNEPFYRDGILHLTHAVRNVAFSGIHYVAIDVSNDTAVRDIVIGDPTHYHNYPAVAANLNGDVILSYSRSALDEYMGAYYSIIPKNGDPSQSYAMQEGRGNYVVTYGGTRNRWGDYNGAWVDPNDGNNFWVFAEYVRGTNTWGNWLSGVRNVPYDNPTIASSTDVLQFGEVEIPNESDTLQIIFKNYGAQTLSISNISNSLPGYFPILSSLTFPIDLAAYDSTVIELNFTPGTTTGFLADTLIVESNDPVNSMKKIALLGRGFEIIPVQEGVLYAVSSPTNSSSTLISLNADTGEGTEIGDVELSSVVSMSISPDGNELVGMIQDVDKTYGVRINSAQGDGHILGEVPIELNGLVFDSQGRTLGFTNNKEIYQIDDGVPTLLSTLSIIPSTMVNNPLDGQMWMTERTGTNSAKLHKIDVDTGANELVASISINPSHMAFDASGELFAVHKNSSILVRIDTLSGEVTEMGSIGFSRVKGIAILGDVISGIGNGHVTSLLPKEFSLSQNHPNPFNPTTKIEFSLPVNSQVKLSVYNILGEEIAILKKGEMNAGFHEVDFSALRLSSGVYIYKLHAIGQNGKVFTESKKMVLMK